MTDELFSVKDQVVVISGASRGIGLRIAKGFVERGAKVIISGCVTETVEEAARSICPPGGVVTAKTCDVADTKAGQKMIDEVVEEFGRIDTLVNCAGVNKRMPVEDYDEETYDFITDQVMFVDGGTSCGLFWPMRFSMINE
ncbi:MAG: SDR family oxidoreductase [Pirellulales bacterium]|nr:SDR family oxidoreductase [Pirellulales bacterium]